MAAVIPVALHTAYGIPSPITACPELDTDGGASSSIKSIPPQLTEELKRKMQGSLDGKPVMAGRDEPWQVDDVISSGPSLPWRRFIRGGRTDLRWYIWYERGGRVHSFYMAIFDFPSTERYAKVVAHLHAMPDQICSITRDHLADPIPASEPEHDIW